MRNKFLRLIVFGMFLAFLTHESSAGINLNTEAVKESVVFIYSATPSTTSAL